MIIALAIIGGCHHNSTNDNNPEPAKTNSPPPMNDQAKSPPSAPAKPAQPIASPAPPPPPTSSPAAARPYTGPPVTAHVVMLKTYPAQYVASIELTAPTGGWKLTLDKGEIAGDAAKVYFTLERPGKDEMVTQSLVKLDGSFKTTVAFTKAEIYINLSQRGVETLTTDYRLATSTK